MNMISTPCCALCGSDLPTTVAAAPIHEQARLMLAAELTDVTEDCLRFFATLFADGQVYRTSTELAYDLAVREGTLNCRFHRAGLPSPKQYVTAAMLMRLADLRTRHSFPAAVEKLGLSSPQSVGRTIRHETGLSVSAFFAANDAATLLAQFRRELITPYLATLRGFRPLTTGAAIRAVA
jgi:hypothetical protein